MSRIIKSVSGNTLPLSALEAQYGKVFKYDSVNNRITEILDSGDDISSFNYLDFNASESFTALVKWTKDQEWHDGNNFKGLYRIIGTNLTYVPGYMIDLNYNKYVLVSSQISSVSQIDSYYVPEGTANNEYGLGKNQKLSGILKNTEYQLKEGEYLLINYTDSKTDTEGKTTESVVNKVYTKGTIIRPNFDLFDSESVHDQGKSYSKTEGYDFSNTEDITYSNEVPGMFSLGTDQKIEVRDFAEVILDDSSTFVYWNLNLTDDSSLVLTRNESSDDFSYILKEGEYFYYTDVNKLDFAYYGNGTEIIYHNTNVEGDTYSLKKISTEANINAETIESEGLSSIPWVRLNLSDTIYLKMREYQYINLTSGDKLISIDIDDNKLTNKWVEVNKQDDSYAYVSFIINNAVSSLTELSVDGVKWEVRSRLDLDCSPSNVQTLYNEYDKVTLTLNLIKENGGLAPVVKTVELYPNDKNNPISFKTNYVAQSTSGELDTHVTVIDGNDNEKVVNDFKLKVLNDSTLSFSYNSSSSSESISLDLSDQIHNIDDSFTQLDFSDVKEYCNNHLTTIEPINECITGYLNTGSNYKAIPIGEKKNFGLLMIYYSTSRKETDEDYNLYDNAAIKLYEDNGIKSDTVIGQKPTLYNVKEDLIEPDTQWWKGYATIDGATSFSPEKYYLKPGMNLILIDKPTKISFYSDTVELTTSEIQTPQPYRFNIYEEGKSSWQTEEEYQTCVNNIVASIFGEDDAETIHIFARYLEGEDTNKVFFVEKESGNWIMKSGTINASQVIEDKEVLTYDTEVFNVKNTVLNDEYKLLLLLIQNGIVRVRGRKIQNNDKIIISDLRIFSAIVYKENLTLQNTPYDYTDLGINLDLLRYYNLNDKLISQNITLQAEKDYYAAKQLLDDIKALDKNAQFFYSCPMDKSSALNINTLATGENKESLASPRVWYDSNNMNNNFTISEIDADELSSGISIAWSSKL